MRVSILIIVATVVILIIAVVLVTIFGGGIERFLQIWGGFSTNQLVTSSCQTKCYELCSKGGITKPELGTVNVGGTTYKCSDYHVACDCSVYIPGGLAPSATTKKGPGEPCESNDECQSGVCGADNQCAGI